ncbi:MAG: NUDIX hydrolase [Chthoniobacterales bacterium]
MSVGTGDWQVLESEAVAKTPYLEVNREVVVTPTRPEGLNWMVVRRKQAAIISARTPEGNYLMVRQERIPVRREFWEFAAGQVDETDVDEAAIRKTAVRELGEETGYEIGGELIPMGYYFSSPGFTDEWCHLFLATDVVPRAGGVALDENEGITECREFAREELVAMIASGEICDANTLCSVARMTALGLF